MKLSGYFAIIASAAVIAVGCTKTEEAGALKEREITITASFADEGQTKTTLKNAGVEVFWEPQEAIKVFLAGQEGYFVSTNTETAYVAQFRGYIESVIGGGEGYFGGEYMWGLYPYRDDAVFDGTYVTTTLPSSQTGCAQSFASNTNITLAKSTTTTLAFYNVCGGVRFSLTHEGVREVVFRGNNGEDLAGRISLAFENGVPAVEEVEDGVQVVRLTLPGNAAFEVGKWYYIVAIPGALENGYTMTFNTQTQHAELVSSGAVSIRRGIFGSLEDADAGLTYQDHSFLTEAVDLGLSVKWATCNVGAYSPDGYGGYYAWGETETKEYYDWTNYMWGNPDGCTISKYNFDSSYGTVDHKAFLDLEDDVAHQMWGGNWRIPTYEEWAELNDNCSVTNTTNNGVNGFLITSNIAGYTDRSIFLPFAGHKVNSETIYEGKRGEYWMSSLYHEDSQYTRLSDMYNNKLNPYAYIASRCEGYSVRPVLCESNVTSVTLDRTEVTIPQGSSFQLSATILPSDAPQSEVWTSSDNSVAMVTEYGQVYGVNPGTCTVFVSVTNGKTAECTVTVTEMEPRMEYVDLGLSVKWATCNVGASKPEDIGGYYSWGSCDIQYVYNWYSYPYSNGSRTTLTKYNTDSNYGMVDNKTILDPEDDVAHVKWGNNWRMPTEEEWSELMENCTCELTTVGGIYGYLVTSNKSDYTDRSIFLPTSGYRFDANIDGIGSVGYYWSSSLNSDLPYAAWYIPISSKRMYSCYRFYGFPVRPVYAGEDMSELVISSASLDFGEVLVGETVTKTLTLRNNGPKDLNVSSVSLFQNTGEYACDWSGGVIVGGGSKTVTVSFSPTQSTSCNCSLNIASDADNGGGALTSIPVSGKGIERLVDLGLSVKWATCNLGALKPEESGRYFAWGDVVGQTWDGSSWSGGGFSTYPEYELDSNNNLKSEFDAAHVNLGDNWRMPTEAEYQELIDNCTSIWTDNYNGSGIAGSIFTSNKAGYTDKSIFLPATGDCGSVGVGLSFYGSCGQYWSGSISFDNYSIGIYFDLEGSLFLINYFRNYGHSVRPVTE